MNHLSTSDDYRDLLIKFRKLGGVANNIDIRKGTYGYGLFSYYAEKTSTLLIPEKLMMPISCVEIDEAGDIILNHHCTWDDERKFFF